MDKLLMEQPLTSVTVTDPAAAPARGRASDETGYHQLAVFRRRILVPVRLAKGINVSAGPQRNGPLAFPRFWFSRNQRCQT
jgi:hypothetical protein